MKTPRIVYIGALACAYVVAQDISNFENIEFPVGITLKVPSNWKAYKPDEIKTGAAAAEAITGNAMQNKLTILSAQSSKENAFGYAGARLSIARTECLTQEALRNMTLEEVEEVRAFTAQQFKDMEAKSNLRARNVTLIRTKHKMHFALLTSYVRNSLDETGEVSVRQFVIPFGDRQVTLTLSYNVKMAPVWEPICDHILESFALTNSEFWPALSNN